MVTREPNADYDKKWRQIIAKARSDAAFRQRLIENPKSVAAEHGINIPPRVEIEVVENAPTVVRIVLTGKQAQSALSDEQLEAVAGGTAGIGAPRLGKTNTATVYGDYTIDIDGSVSARRLKERNPPK